MDGSALTTGEWVALVGAAVAFFAVFATNLDKIIGFFEKYIPKLAKCRENKRQAELKEKLKIVVPEILAEHTKSQKGNCYNEIAGQVLSQAKIQTADVVSNIKGSLDEIKQINADQILHMQKIDKRLDKIENRIDNINERLDSVEEGVKDSLRQRINEIYYEAKKTLTISASKKTELMTLYRDYKQLHGNSYIDDRYKFVMEDCETTTE